MRRVGLNVDIDGLISAEAEGVRFHPVFLTDCALAKVRQQTRRRALKQFQRRELLPADTVGTVQAWEHSVGFHQCTSLCISVRAACSLANWRSCRFVPQRRSLGPVLGSGRVGTVGPLLFARAPDRGLILFCLGSERRRFHGSFHHAGHL